MNPMEMPADNQKDTALPESTISLSGTASLQSEAYSRTSSVRESNTDSDNSLFVSVINATASNMPGSVSEFDNSNDLKIVPTSSVAHSGEHIPFDSGESQLPVVSDIAKEPIASRSPDVLPLLSIHSSKDEKVADSSSSLPVLSIENKSHSNPAIPVSSLDLPPASVSENNPVSPAPALGTTLSRLIENSKIEPAKSESISQSQPQAPSVQIEPVKPIEHKRSVEAEKLPDAFIQVVNAGVQRSTEEPSQEFRQAFKFDSSQPHLPQPEIVPVPVPVPGNAQLPERGSLLPVVSPAAPVEHHVPGSSPTLPLSNSIPPVAQVQHGNGEPVPFDKNISHGTAQQPVSLFDSLISKNTAVIPAQEQMPRAEQPTHSLLHTLIQQSKPEVRESGSTNGDNLPITVTNNSTEGGLRYEFNPENPSQPGKLITPVRETATGGMGKELKEQITAATNDKIVPSNSTLNPALNPVSNPAALPVDSGARPETGSPVTAQTGGQLSGVSDLLRGEKVSKGQDTTDVAPHGNGNASVIAPERPSGNSARPEVSSSGDFSNRGANSESAPALRIDRSENHYGREEFESAKSSLSNNEKISVKETVKEPVKENNAGLGSSSSASIYERENRSSDNQRIYAEDSRSAINGNNSRVESARESERYPIGWQNAGQSAHNTDSATIFIQRPVRGSGLSDLSRSVVASESVIKHAVSAVSEIAGLSKNSIAKTACLTGALKIDLSSGNSDAKTVNWQNGEKIVSITNSGRTTNNITALKDFTTSSLKGESGLANVNSNGSANTGFGAKAFGARDLGVKSLVTGSETAALGIRFDGRGDCNVSGIRPIRAGVDGIQINQDIGGIKSISMIGTARGDLSGANQSVPGTVRGEAAQIGSGITLTNPFTTTVSIDGTVIGTTNGASNGTVGGMRGDGRVAVKGEATQVAQGELLGGRGTISPQLAASIVNAIKFGHPLPDGVTFAGGELTLRNGEEVLFFPGLKAALKFAEAFGLVDKGIEEESEDDLFVDLDALAKDPDSRSRTRYLVKKDDTIESISERQLGDRRYTDLIITINRSEIIFRLADGIRVPVVYEGQVLSLPSLYEKAVYARHFLRGAAGSRCIDLYAGAGLSSDGGTTMEDESSGLERSSRRKLHEEFIDHNADALRARAQAPVETPLGRRLRDVRYAGSRRSIPFNDLIEKTVELTERQVMKVRLGQSLQSIAAVHPNLGDVRYWRLLAQVNDLSAEVDAFGKPLAGIEKGMTLRLPTADEIRAFSLLSAIPTPIMLQVAVADCDTANDDYADRRTSDTIVQFASESSSATVVTERILEVRELEQDCRIVVSQSSGGSGDFSIRLQHRQGESWNLVASYDKRGGKASRTRYGSNGTSNSLNINLPDVVVGQMAIQDLSRNLAFHIDAYKNNRTRAVSKQSSLRLRPVI